ncbi:hypothetical protein [Agriterribacter sp.]|uniref:hypothetical protein n=1 Tax=Agriterribacter sp. TaxID=2821509 RepID=UPI002B9F6987|nr:hypothetical protein [Agriterribacter sp.]HRP55739.1 hypothetical protein [Agriterribacter sp.]
MLEKIKRKANLVLLSLCCLISFKGAGQTTHAVKDTVYVILLKSALENNRPIASYAVLKDLSLLGRLKTIADRDAFICELFKHSTIFEEPSFTLSQNLKLYNFASEGEQQAYLKKLSGKIARLNKNFTFITRQAFSKGNTIEISGAKLYGEFWRIPEEPEQLNNYSHSFLIEKECYNKSYIYNLKDISRSSKINKEDRASILASTAYPEATVDTVVMNYLRHVKDGPLPTLEVVRKNKRKSVRTSNFYLNPYANIQNDKISIAAYIFGSGTSHSRRYYLLETVANNKTQYKIIDDATKEGAVNNLFEYLKKFELTDGETSELVRGLTFVYN